MMNQRYSPRTLIVVSLCGLVLAMVWMTWLRLQVPQLGVELQATGKGCLQVTALQRHSPNRNSLQVGDCISVFSVPGVEIAARPDLIMEEPDTLPSKAAYRDFLTDQQYLHDGLMQGRLMARLTDGSQAVLQHEPAAWHELPRMFWFQLVVGFAGLLTVIMVWSIARSDLSTRLYALTGVGFSLSALTAAVYSTRELAMPADTIRLLSAANHFGALLFTAALSSLLFVYPHRLGRVWPVLMVCFGSALLLWLADTLFLTTSFMVFHVGVLIIFTLSFVFSGVQWWQTRRLPAERAALRWFLVAIYIGTSLFAGFIILPAAFGLPGVASQGIMFSAFLVMFWGLSLGVARYRLFKLEVWWRSIWAWLLSGIVILIVDFLLIRSLQMDSGQALTLSVALVGWLYFPARQWLWGRFGKAASRPLSDWLPDVMPLLLNEERGVDQEERLLARWPQLLQVVFRPLQVSRGEGAAPRLLDDGLGLMLPDSNEDAPPWELRHADRGSRLFHEQDIATFASLSRLFSLTLDICHARDQGARVERERIARDVHDDLGARLLTLLYRSPEGLKPLVRESIQDSRELINTLSQEAVLLELAVARWRGEFGERCEVAGLRGLWQSHGDLKTLALSARQHANLTRVLREAVTNVIKHAGASQIQVSLRCDGEHLHIEVHDDGRGTAEQLASGDGRGLAIMRARTVELGGRFSIVCSDGCRVEIDLPLTAPSIPDGDTGY